MQLLRKDNPLTPSWNLVRPSIDLLREHFWPVFYLSFLPGLIVTVGLVLATSGVHPNQTVVHVDGRMAIGVILALFGALWSGVARPGFLILQIRAVHGEHAEAMECFKRGLHRFIPYIGMSLLAALLIILGSFALIVPGLILARGFYLAQYYVVDDKIDMVDALRKSFNDSRPNAGWIWGLIGVTVIFGVLGSLLGRLPVAGYLLSLITSYIYIFAPAIRYAEIAKDFKVRNKAQ
jgi:hypothetical protein